MPLLFKKNENSLNNKRINKIYTETWKKKLYWNWIIINKNNYTSIAQNAVYKHTNNLEKQQKINNALFKLIDGVSNNYDSKNREIFGNNFGELRQIIKL